MSNLEETAGREERIAEIIAGYLEARDKGVEPSLDQIFAAHPQFEEELREFFKNYALVRGVIGRGDPDLPRLGADYENLVLIDGGGQGRVFKAHQKSLNKVVAVKVPRQSSLRADPEGIRKEAQRAARLRHPHIVPVHYVGEHEGQLFCVMEFIEGQTLAARIKNGPLRPDEAVQYVKKVADAIHYAHQRQILHCDLKPANILLDDEGNPYVTDFGLAKLLGENNKVLSASAGGGTAGYMAPEQVRGDELTTATDVYGLGAILYTLLTGSPPFEPETLAETFRLVREKPPTPPREKNPDVDQDLEAICLMCLSKDKDQRYGSAYGVWKDLSRYQAGEETMARVWGRSEQTIRWGRRNPVAAGLILTAVLISILTVVMAVSVANARKDAQLQEALQSNTFAARDLAKTALLQLRDLSDSIKVSADGAALPGLLSNENQAGLQRYVEQICNTEATRFVSCFVLNADGIIVARVREDGRDEITQEQFGRRDYFLGAKGHAGLQGRSSVHISKVYRGRIDDLYKFGISAPILSGNGKFLGAICATVTTDAALGLVISEDARRTVAVLAPKDVENPEMVTLFHPAYKHGVPAVDFRGKSPMAPSTRRVHEEELNDSKLNFRPQDDYVDPVGSAQAEYAGRWIAGMAQIGNTGFIVTVQQRYTEALALDTATYWNLTFWSTVVIFLIVAAVMVFWRWARPSSATI